MDNIHIESKLKEIEDDLHVLKTEMKATLSSIARVVERFEQHRNNPEAHKV